MSGFDYRTVKEWPDSPHGLCMLEWDIALDQRGRAAFAREANADRDRVLVAPYQYGSRGTLPDVDEGAAFVEAFGFGCIYFPRSVLRDALAWFCAPTGGRLTDETFSTWYTHFHGPARVTWDVHPQHLREF